MGYTLRVSVLEHCQLRCNYCMPDAMSALSKKSWLSLEQYEKIAMAMRPLVMDKVRFTGGEPLLRRDLAGIMQVFSRVFCQATIALTTNGLRFSAMKHELLRAGLEAVTFHLDTLKEDRYGNLMGQGSVKTVLDAILEARSEDLNVKINMVVQKGVNDDELHDFLSLSRSLSVRVRFIELMNTGSAKNYVQKTFISGADILHNIACFTKLTAIGRNDPSAPAELFKANDLGVTFGLIASDTRPFCANCNRLRLSADGRMRTCLYEPVGHRLKISDDELMREIAMVVAKKTSFHPALKKNLQNFSMSQIGG